MATNSPKENKDEAPVLSKSLLGEIVDIVMDTFSSISTLSIVKFLCISVAIGSFVYEFTPLQDSYFSNKYNVLNQYFVKLAWGWTMTLHTPFIIVSGLLQSPVNYRHIIKGLVRVVIVGTAVWYCWVEIVFHRVLLVTGACVGDDSLTDLRACFKAGHHWNGFDISGHCFLLIYSALLIHEELRIVRSNLETSDCDTNTNIDSRLKLIVIHKICTTLLIFLELLWMLMVMTTSIYFHAWSHKLIGTSIALASWHFTYNIVYKKDVLSMLI